MAESGKTARTAGKRRKWPYVVAIVFFIVAGLLLIAQDQATLRVESPVEASAPRVADYVASLVGAAVEPGDAYTVLRNGDAFPPMLEAIDQATSRITFETYVFKDEAIGERFMQALERASRRGVKVRMILDPIGSVLKKENEERMAKAGIQLSWFNPLKFWTLEETNYRTHRKVLVVDGDVALTATVDILKAIAGGTGPRQSLLALGYSGWGPGQLDTEIRSNGWLHVAADSNLVFDPRLDDKWERAMSKIGIDHRMLSDEAGHA